MNCFFTTSLYVFIPVSRRNIDVTIYKVGWTWWWYSMRGQAHYSGQSAFDYIDIRDDRVYTYFSLNPGERKTFVVQLSAAYRGKFYLPAFACEAMYDESVRVNTEGKWV